MKEPRGKRPARFGRAPAGPVRGLGHKRPAARDGTRISRTSKALSTVSGIFSLGAIATAAGGALLLFGAAAMRDWPAASASAAPDLRAAVSLKAPDARPKGQARSMPLCGRGKRINCVVDGDTMWFDGEKIRLSGIDAPEVKGKCSFETALAAKATRRLSAMLSGETLTIERSGQDRFGRTLARVQTANGEAGERMVREGLARPWTGRKEVWCASG